MRSKLKIFISGMCAAGLLVSVSGCFRIPGTKKYSYEDVSGKLLKEATVKEWDGAVPDGMEVRYAVTRKLYTDYEGHSSDTRYEYDKAGHRNAEINVNDKYTVRVSVTYNDDGTVAGKEKETTGKVTGYHQPDYIVSYEYDGEGRLISFSRTVIKENGNDEPEKNITELEYENGFLVRIDDDEYPYNDTELPYFQYVVEVSDDMNDDYFAVYKCFYDENWVLTSMEKGEKTITYEYDDDGVLTGWTSADRWGRLAYYNAEGVFLYEIDADGEMLRRDTYNEHGDNICQEHWRDGKYASKNDAAYEYDANGNKTVENKDFWSVNSDGEERSFKAKTTYTYDEHGLLISELSEIDGRFNHMTVYAYEAILVSAD